MNTTFVYQESISRWPHPERKENRSMNTKANRPGPVDELQNQRITATRSAGHGHGNGVLFPLSASVPVKKLPLRLHVDAGRRLAIGTVVIHWLYIRAKAIHSRRCLA